jgi:ribose-phosphate pyrophosphokinase
MELFLMVRCFRRASARTVTAIMPYYGYSRQDEKRRPRVPIAASDIAMLLEAAGVDRVLALDLHSGQIQGQFQHCPVDNLSMFEDFAEFFVKNLLPTMPEDSEIAIVSPDADGTARAKFFLGILIEKGKCCVNRDIPSCQCFQVNHILHTNSGSIFLFQSLLLLSTIMRCV